MGHKEGDQFTFHWWDHVFNKASTSMVVESAEVCLSSHKCALITEQVYMLCYWCCMLAEIHAASRLAYNRMASGWRRWQRRMELSAWSPTRSHAKQHCPRPSFMVTLLRYRTQESFGPMCMWTRGGSGLVSWCQVVIVCLADSADPIMQARLSEKYQEHPFL